MRSNIHLNSQTVYVFVAIKKSVDASRPLVLASCFEGSWPAVELNSSKGLYRSSEWLASLLYKEKVVSNTLLGKGGQVTGLLLRTTYFHNSFNQEHVVREPKGLL